MTLSASAVKTMAYSADALVNSTAISGTALAPALKAKLSWGSTETSAWRAADTGTADS